MIMVRVLILQLISMMIAIMFLLGLCKCETDQSSPYRKITSSDDLLLEREPNALPPNFSPSMGSLMSQPLLPLLAPSPLMPFTNNGVPKLSGRCALNFSGAETLLAKTSTDCWGSLAPYLANVVCCPQIDATLTVLIGQSSIYSKKIALNETEAKHCLSDVEQILEAKGANNNLHEICSIYPSNLTEASCPVVDVNEVESVVDIRKILSACQKIDSIDECCSQVCQNALSDAAEKIAAKSYGAPGLVAIPVSPSLTVINDCKKIVLRWLASKLDISSANSALRGISTCTINKVCPLTFPELRNVSKECGNTISNHTACCEAMGIFMSDLQEQSFITNLQALNCAALLGQKLQKANVSSNVYDICHINLKDFSLQVGSQDSGCLLPSLTSDVTYDESSGISFTCDLNDNVAAPWPSPNSLVPVSSCKPSTQLPAIPKATSAQSGLYVRRLTHSLLFSSLLVLKLLL